MADVVDLVEQSKDTVDDVWRQTDFEPYPETRMIRLMDVIGESPTQTHTKTRKLKQIFAAEVVFKDLEKKTHLWRNLCFPWNF